MENLLSRRLVIMAITVAAILGGVYGYGYLKFPFNFVVIAISVGAIIAALILETRKEKSARLKIFYSTANEFGRPISFENHFASFERNGTRFDCEFPQDEDNTAIKVSFFLPNIRQRFNIRHGGIFGKSMPGCVPVQLPQLAEHVELQSESAEFLSDLLKNKELVDEIHNYPKSIMTAFSIVFDGGDFLIQWTPRVSEQIDGFRHVCRTAVVFHDELKKSAAIM
jgi:hypothetical protein